MEEMSLGGYWNCREVRTQRGFYLKAFIQKQGEKVADFVDQGIVELFSFSSLSGYWVEGPRSACLVNLLANL